MQGRLPTSVILVMTLVGTLLAQEAPPQAPGAPPAAEAQKPRPTPRPPRRPAAPTSEPAPRPAQKQVEPTVVKLERGGRVAVSNRLGSITITGWDRDTIEARGSSEQGWEAVKHELQGTRVLLSVPAEYSHGSRREIDLDVKVPRYAELSLVEVHRGDVQITDLDGSVTVSSASGDLHIAKVGSLRLKAMHGDLAISDVKGDLFAQTMNGDVTVGRVGGLVDVGSTNGDLIVQNAGGNVSARSASGDISIDCAKGNVDAKTASGSITMTAVNGDVDASTASGDVGFKGFMRAGGRYRMKSVSGEVEMMIQPDPPGFTATLQSYNGEIETAFPLKLDGSVQGGPTNRRVIGRYGDGQAQLTLDSFGGSVRLVKGTAAELKECK